MISSRADANTIQCDVLVASFDGTLLRTAGFDLVKSLRRDKIAADLASDARSSEELSAKHTDDQYSWIIIVKQDSTVKVRSMTRSDLQDIEMPITSLLPWIRTELRERDHREGNQDRVKLQRHSSHHGTSTFDNSAQDVQVLSALHRSKKINRANVVEEARSRIATVGTSSFDGPIIAIETSDQVIDGIRETRISDTDSWRKLSQSVPLAERKYVLEIYGLLKAQALEYKGITNHSWIYNFRTRAAIYYDLGTGRAGVQD